MNEALESVLAELDEALADERAALMRLDTSGVEACTDRKAVLADRLGTMMKEADSQAPGKRPQLLRMLSRIRWTAEANRALLADASELLSSVRAMPIAKGTYNRRACVERSAPVLARYGT
ncbi:MAG: hypothetical protein JKY37_04970 [Nannocystaceae bacterium]|nr:hypothetical protein [Nannocystaceae bacterium]